MRKQNRVAGSPLVIDGDLSDVESSNFQVTVVPTETVRAIRVNMKFLIYAVDQPLTVAELPEAGAAEMADVEGGDQLGPPPIELELHAAAARAAISATKTRSGR